MVSQVESVQIDVKFDQERVLCTKIWLFLHCQDVILWTDSILFMKAF